MIKKQNFFTIHRYGDIIEDAIAEGAQRASATLSTIWQLIIELDG